MSDGKRIWVCPVHGPVEPGQVGVKRRCLVQPVSRGVVGEPICGEPCEPFIAESERQAHIRDLEAQNEKLRGALAELHESHKQMAVEAVRDLEAQVFTQEELQLLIGWWKAANTYDSRLYNGGLPPDYTLIERIRSLRTARQEGEDRG